MSLRTPILTTSPEISAEVEAPNASSATRVVANAAFICVPFEELGALSYPKVVVQFVGPPCNILVADHVDALPALDDVMTVGEGRGKVKILLDQEDREPLLLKPADPPADLLHDDAPSL